MKENFSTVTGSVTCSPAEARLIVGVGRTKFSQLQKHQDFPRPLLLGYGRCIRFKTAELLEWLDRLPRAIIAEPACLAQARVYRDGKLVRGRRGGTAR